MVINGKQFTLSRPISSPYSQSNPQKKTPDVESIPADKSQKHAKPASVKTQQHVSEWISELTDSI